MLEFTKPSEMDGLIKECLAEYDNDIYYVKKSNADKVLMHIFQWAMQK